MGGGVTLPKQRRHVELYRWHGGVEPLRFSFMGLDEVELLADELLKPRACIARLTCEAAGSLSSGCGCHLAPQYR